MVQKFTREEIAKVAIIHAAPPVPGRDVPVDRSFELPTRLYAAFAGLCLAFLGITAYGFGNPGLVIPMAIFTLFIVAFFAVPAIWTRLAPDNAVRPKSWANFRQNGIRTYTGHNSAQAATVQMLLLPVLLVGWGVAVVTIAAVVR